MMPTTTDKAVIGRPKRYSLFKIIGNVPIIPNIRRITPETPRTVLFFLAIYS